MNLGDFLILRGSETYDGAGVKLKRIFGSIKSFNYTDPFLLLDFFGSDQPDDYLAGFPWHPHRGIETLTYVIRGKVEHEDSLGNKGVIRSGEIQWMNAGSGIFHQEMPSALPGESSLFGFQLWINIPSDRKMSRPSYRGISYNRLETADLENFNAKIIEGIIDSEGSIKGRDHQLGIIYLDITAKKDNVEIFKPQDFTSLIVPLNGSIEYKGYTINKAEALIIYGKGENINLKTDKGSRFLYISGKRTNESVAWYGPVVMNTWEQIEIAMRDLENGTFVRDLNPIFME